MKPIKSIILIFSISIIVIFLILSGIPQGNAYIYFSGTRNIYGDGLGLTGMYTGLANNYNLYGLGGLYGGMYGSLYNMYPFNAGITPLISMNLSNIYGLGSFYRNILGLNSYGGLYGLSWPFGLSGIYGLYGSGGLFGVNSILGGLSGLDGILATANPFANLGLFTSLTPNFQPAASVTSEQAGTWTGNWFSYIKINDFGAMNLNLVEDTETSLLIGEVNLLLNNITGSVPAQVSGFFNGGSTFILSGGNNTIFTSTFLIVPAATLYSIELNCTLTSPVTMTGTYFVQDLVKLLTDDIGSFNLSLSSPVI